MIALDGIASNMASGLAQLSVIWFVEELEESPLAHESCSTSDPGHQTGTIRASLCDLENVFPNMFSPHCVLPHHPAPPQVHSSQVCREVDAGVDALLSGFDGHYERWPPLVARDINVGQDMGVPPLGMGRSMDMGVPPLAMGPGMGMGVPSLGMGPGMGMGVPPTVGSAAGMDMGLQLDVGAGLGMGMVDVGAEMARRMEALMPFGALCVDDVKENLDPEGGAPDCTRAEKQPRSVPATDATLIA